MSAASGEWAPAFGLTGVRRALAIAAAAILLTGIFVVLGFPYDRLVPRISQAIEAATGARVSIGRLGLGVAWLGPQLRAWDVDVTTPSGRRVPIDRLRVHPAWSLSWLRGMPSLAVAVRSPLGEVDGTLRVGQQPAFDGTLKQFDLAQLPLDLIAPGASLDGRGDAELDLEMVDTGVEGSARFDVRDGSFGLPMLPIGVPFDGLHGDIALGGETLARIDAFEMTGPLLQVTAKGTLGQAPATTLAPLALEAQIEVRDANARSLLQAQGIRLGADGKASFSLGGTLGDPQVQTGRAATPRPVVRQP